MKPLCISPESMLSLFNNIIQQGVEETFFLETAQYKAEYTKDKQHLLAAGLKHINLDNYLVSILTIWEADFYIGQIFQMPLLFL